MPVWRHLKRALVGRPLRTAQAVHERLTKVEALAIFSSDALSSVAYATEEILLALVLAGTAAMAYSLPIAVAIALLLAIVASSYRQTVHAYPNGGGSYIVAKANLGTIPGLTAGAALLIDYVLTVAVSAASGVAAITSAFPELYPYRVALGVAAIAVIALGNLRGVREAGVLFSIPTYLFIASFAVMLGAGLYGLLADGVVTAVEPVATDPSTGMQALTLFLLLRAFASGCAAMTGVEAISNGVQAFRPPESRNAAATMVWMAAILAVLFLGITVLAQAFGVGPREAETVVSQIARAVFGRTWFYYVIQAAMATILILAANTSFNGFPRLACLMARDGYLPNQLAYLGERLVYSNGIVLLALVAAALLVVFQGDTHALIPLYAIGVFLSFTLSQAGMVRKWVRERGPGYLGHALVNGVGALTTTVVLVIVAVTKFKSGAWMVVLLIPLLVRGFMGIHAHYARFRVAMAVNGEDLQPVQHTVLVPIGHVNKSVFNTLRYARSLGSPIQAVYVALDPEKAEQVKADWDRLESGVPLVVINSPYRSVVRPLIHYIHHVERKSPGHMVTVLLPEFVMARWWENLLHNNTALYIKAALLFEPGVVVASVPYHLSKAV